MWTDGKDKENLSKGIYNAYTQRNLRYSQVNSNSSSYAHHAVVSCNANTFIQAFARQRLTPQVKSLLMKYCKTLIIRVTLFSRDSPLIYIHETQFLRFELFCSTIPILKIIGEVFIFVSLSSCEFTQK